METKLRMKMRRGIPVIAMLLVLLLGLAFVGKEPVYAASKVDPGKVASFSLTVTGQPLAKLEWSMATGDANGYTIVRDNKSYIRINSKEVLSYVDESIEPGKSYSYKVYPHFKDANGQLIYGTASPEKKVVDGYTYKKEENGTVTLTGFSGQDKKIRTPDMIGNVKVGKIGDSCFRGNVWIKKVTISEGVTTIDNYAFEACGLLRVVKLPESLNTIGEGAFSGCGQLYSCDMPDSVTDIGRGAFLFCTRLLVVDLPKDLKTMGKFAFAGCEKLEDVTFNGTELTEIPDRAFCQCSKLRKIEIPGSVKTIGKRAFSDCETLETCKLEGTVSIGDYAFERCYIIQDFEGDIAKLSIGFGAFSNLNMGSPDSIDKRLTFPDNTEFREGAFYGSGITGIINKGGYGGGTSTFTNHILNEGVLYSADGKTLLAYFPMKMKGDYFEYTDAYNTGEFTVPDGVETIAPYAFYGSKLKKVNLPESLLSIQHNAFTMSGVSETALSGGSKKVIDPKAFENYEYEYGAEESYELETNDLEGHNIENKGISTQSTDEGEAPTGTATSSFTYESLANGGCFDENQFAGYVDIHDDFEKWCKDYVAYNKDNVPMTAEAMPYITMYTGELHYRQMSSALSGEIYKTQQSILRSGDDYQEMYLMIDHGLFAELSRGKMPGNLLLYSGISPYRVNEIAGLENAPETTITDEVRNRIIGRIGCEFTDNSIMSTTASLYIAFGFSNGEYGGSNTIVLIYASKESLEHLGAICVDNFSNFSGEEEILFNTGARYRILDAGTAKQIDTYLDDQGNVTGTIEGEQRTYVKLQLLGGDAVPSEKVTNPDDPEMTKPIKGTSIKKLKKSKKAIKVKWKKQSAKYSGKHITGYQIQLATNKKFTKNKKTVTVKGYKKVSKKVKGLKRHKKYYVRIRTYLNYNGTRRYSKWSKVKKKSTG